MVDDDRIIPPHRLETENVSRHHPATTPFNGFPACYLGRPSFAYFRRYRPAAMAVAPAIPTDRH